MNRVLYTLQIICISLILNVFADSGKGITSSFPTDYLTEHPILYVGVVLGFFAVQTIVLLLMGQPCLFKNKLKIWYGDTNGPENSQHICDWYTFIHILHGVIMYYLTYYIPSPITVNYCYIMALATAATWEIVENTPCVINKYRMTAVAQGYNGDSVINSFSDTVAMSGGFWICYVTPWWVILIGGLLEEIILGVVIRDNFLLNVVQLLFSLKFISDWQERGRKGGKVEAVSQNVDDP